jgi:beta-galactosidase GanA
VSWELFTSRHNPKRRERQPVTGIIHGTPSSYTNHKCGCDPCTEAWRIYHYERYGVKRLQKGRAATEKQHDSVVKESLTTPNP